MTPPSIFKVQVITYCRAPDIRVLLLQRPSERGSIWQPVTGKMEPGEQHCLEAARRELEEETGIKEVLHFVETGIEFHFESAGSKVTEYLVGAEVAPFHPVALSSEHVAFAWLPPLDASERLAWETNREGLQIVLLAAEGDGLA